MIKIVGFNSVPSAASGEQTLPSASLIPLADKSYDGKTLKLPRALETFRNLSHLTPQQRNRKPDRNRRIGRAESLAIHNGLLMKLLESKTNAEVILMSNSKRNAILALVAAVALMFTGSAFAADAMDVHTTGKFAGPKANTGFVTHSKKDGKNVLTLSDDFVVPDTPDPHWQVVTSDGAVFLLDKVKIKSLTGDKVKKEIVLPGYIKDVAKVQIYCAWAEVVLGEASFSSPVM